MSCICVRKLVVAFIWNIKILLILSTLSCLLVSRKLARHFGMRLSPSVYSAREFEQMNQYFLHPDDVSIMKRGKKNDGNGIWNTEFLKKNTLASARSSRTTHRKRMMSSIHLRRSAALKRWKAFTRAAIGIGHSMQNIQALICYIWMKPQSRNSLRTSWRRPSGLGDCF